MSERSQRLFKAVVWESDPAKPGKHVEVYAEDLTDAKLRLEEQYGKGNVFDLHNESDAEKARSA